MQYEICSDYIVMEVYLLAKCTLADSLAQFQPSASGKQVEITCNSQDFQGNSVRGALQCCSQHLGECPERLEAASSRCELFDLCSRGQACRVILLGDQRAPRWDQCV
jgi:hypothetical protein